MTVRKITLTTLSVIVLITGFVFFRLYFIELLSKLFNLISEGEYSDIIRVKLFPSGLIGGWFPALFYFSVITVIAARVLNAIVNHKTALGLLPFFIQPLLLTAVLSIALFVNQINMLQLWAVFYLCLLICLHSTFVKTMLLTESVGSSPNLKLVKGFAAAIKDTARNAFSTGVKRFRNPVDETTALLLSGVILLLEAVTLVSFIIYMATHWRLIFLSHIVNSL